MILVIDNYDSFVHNLARLVRLAGRETEVVRNDALDVEQIEQRRPEALILSPGPGAPADAGCCVEVVRHFDGRVPLLGVCLGHQAIVEALGGSVVRTPEPMHARTSSVRHRGEGLFAGLPSPLTVCRYHSLVANDVPEGLETTAWTDEGVVMAVERRGAPTYGVQFHPEAILTEHGQGLINNFVERLG